MKDVREKAAACEVVAMAHGKKETEQEAKMERKQKNEEEKELEVTLEKAEESLWELWMDLLVVHADRGATCQYLIEETLYTFGKAPDHKKPPTKLPKKPRTKWNALTRGCVGDGQ